jgi:hypothetical protein
MTLDMNDLLEIEYVLYCDIKCKQLNEYDVVGVHHTGYIRSNDGINAAQEKFLSNIPPLAEAVVKYTHTFTPSSKQDYYMVYDLSGLAVIPKTRSEDGIALSDKSK